MTGTVTLKNKISPLIRDSCAQTLATGGVDKSGHSTLEGLMRKCNLCLECNRGFQAVDSEPFCPDCEIKMKIRPDASCMKCKRPGLRVRNVRFRNNSTHTEATGMNCTHVYYLPYEISLGQAEDLKVYPKAIAQLSFL